MVFALALSPALTNAKKPDTGGGGGGGNDGGGGDTSSTLLIAPLDLGAGPQDINDLREVVGFVSTPTGEEAAYWTVSVSNGEIESNLAILSGGRNAYAINSLGEVVGESFGPAGNYVAVYWPNPSSSAIELPPLPDHDVSVALSINNDGLICGYVSKSALDASGEPIPGTYDVPSNRAVVWRVDSSSATPVINGPFELPTNGDGASSSAGAVNDNDENGLAQVVGRGPGGDFLWDVLSHDDGTVSVASTPLAVGVSTGINNSGLISGRLPGRTEVDALVWSRDSTWFLDRGRGRNKVPYAAAWDINDSGLIVGEARTDTSIGAIGRACIWDGIDGSLTYLDGYLPADSPIAELYSAQAVNTFGEIIGYGSPYAFIAVPVSP